MSRLIRMLFVVALVAGCTPKVSVEDLSREVKSSMEKKFAEDPSTSGIKIKNVTLIRKDQIGNEYKGLVEIERFGQQESLAVNVTYDGKNLMWQIQTQ
ncbi:MAG: hypothetical protein WCG79_08310 [Verrucomicrobiota bacterium]